MAPHDFHHDDSLMRQRCAVEAVNTLRRKRNSGIETECKNSGFQIVVDSFRHTDNAQPLALQLVRNAEAAVASNCDEGVKPVLPKTIHEFVGTVGVFESAILLSRGTTEGIASIGCAQDRAAQVRDFAHRRTPKFHQSAARIVLWFQKSVVAVANTEDLPAQITRRIHRTMNDRVQAGCIAASCIDCHSLCCDCHQLLPLYSISNALADLYK